MVQSDQDQRDADMTSQVNCLSSRTGEVNLRIIGIQMNFAAMTKMFMNILDKIGPGSDHSCGTPNASSSYL